MKSMRIVGRVLLFVLLTILTQIGGLAYLLSLLISRLTGFRHILSRILTLVAVYSCLTVVTTVVAPVFGRVPISCFDTFHGTLAVRSPMTCLLNRNYVRPAMLTLVSELAKRTNEAFPGTTTLVLDANFPFLNGFPMFPHLSHTDGRKLDIAFYYKDADGAFLNGRTRSPLGYFAFEQPVAGDELPCAGRRDILTTRWDLNALQNLFPTYQIEANRTAFAVHWLSTEGVQNFSLKKIFLEPHLQHSLGVTGDAVHFQGCRAARHDDHIHFEIN